ncbi:alpha/beta fold hydrolase [Massilia sp. MB5]|uniref:thioesterase II family protein n=1 Tax=unclassified Massilia TaxID=2609279 RepID=UPI0006A2AF29|nr:MULTISPECIES: alpha/beta fold hydrolase [unclassified Massilia]AKU20911.1 hypothetical protein ACZ75_04790 [Massilia sp. NR 4-1]UMR29544.1 alpha/beta fold hydrolase [Massilia sp. MB5]
MSLSNPWIQIFKPQSNAALNLICFPFAGGGTQSFSKWPEYLPDEIEVRAIRLPGRETRLREPAIADVQALIDAMLQAPGVRSCFDKPFVLFGHSMGALIAFELARRLQAEGQDNLQGLLVSGRVAPQCKPPREPIHALAPEDFVRELRRLGGTPDEVLNDPDLMALILPMLRGDFSVNENYAYRPQPRLACDIVAFGGLQDSETTRASVDAWREVGDGGFSLRMVPGDHFFIQSAQALFLRLLAIELYGSLSRLPDTEQLAVPL